VSTQTVQSAGAVAMPRVNLMPPEIAEGERLRRIQMALGGAVLVSAVLVAGLYVHEKSGVSSARSELQAAQTQHTALNAKLASLNMVQQTFAEVQAKQGLLSQAMGQEIRWSYVLNDLSFRIPSNVWLTAVSATETTAGTTSGTTTTTPTTTTLTGSTPASTIGSITFDGVGFRHDDVATWLDSLAREKGFTDPTFSNSSESAIGARGVVSFATSVDLTPKALSNRYTHEAGS
jgi:Tfp pilus assembly protein PilN